MGIDRLHEFAQTAGEPVGRILSVAGSKAGIGLLLPGGSVPENARATVAKFVIIRSGRSVLVGLITDVSLQVSAAAREHGYQATALVDLMGEVKVDEDGSTRFTRGVTRYPAIGDPASLVTSRELALIYNVSGGRLINIGNLQQDAEIEAHVEVDEMLSKHFAVLGTSGVGKSSGIVIILQQVLETCPDLRIFLLDVHNEYGRCFGDKALVLNPRNLKLPFWLFNFEEFVDVVFGARPGIVDEVETLAEIIPQAKSAYLKYQAQGERAALKRVENKVTGYTADTPVPYLLADLITLIDERMGKLENRSSRLKYHKLITRIETLRNDSRYAFMFENANVGGDTMAEVLSQLFRMPPNGKPITIMQLAGFPTEVVDAVVSVLGRMAFDFGLWSDGAMPLLFIAEEAHRYASGDNGSAFTATRKAFSRIAKEGRKYGVHLGVVTQRPAELDPTILSQCGTLFVMRMANERDQEILRAAVSDAAANLLAFVPSLGTREILAFGEGVSLPTRLRFKALPEHALPNSEALGDGSMATDRLDQPFIVSVIDRWRGAMTGRRSRPEDDPTFLEAVRVAEMAPLQPAATVELNPDRFKILKKPAAQPSAVAAPARETMG
jgi:DNA helicase HerA-like ATPase